MMKTTFLLMCLSSAFAGEPDFKVGNIIQIKDIDRPWGIWKTYAGWFGVITQVNNGGTVNCHTYNVQLVHNRNKSQMWTGEDNMRALLLENKESSRFQLWNISNFKFGYEIGKAYDLNDARYSHLAGHRVVIKAHGVSMRIKGKFDVADNCLTYSNVRGKDLTLRGFNPQQPLAWRAQILQEMTQGQFKSIGEEPALTQSPSARGYRAPTTTTTTTERDDDSNSTKKGIMDKIKDNWKAYLIGGFFLLVLFSQLSGPSAAEAEQIRLHAGGCNPCCFIIPLVMILIVGGGGFWAHKTGKLSKLPLPNFLGGKSTVDSTEDSAVTALMRLVKIL